MVKRTSFPAFYRSSSRAGENRLRWEKTAQRFLRIYNHAVQPISREERRKLAQEVAKRACLFRPDVLAVGIYGSVARDEDGPYSDLELLCVLGKPGEDFTSEWLGEPGKVEVNFISEDVLFTQATEVDGAWPLTHGAYVYIRPLHDPTGLLVRLRQAVLSVPNQAFIRAMRALIVEDLVELVGKVRNAQHLGAHEEIPFLAVNLAFHGALLVGLANRHLYRSASKMLAESLGLGAQPPGYARLCARVLAGNLAETAAVARETEEFWQGVEEWCRKHGIDLYKPRRIPF